MNGFIIAGLSSGSGKTTLSIGMMRTLYKRGHQINAFKVGPDYIDPMFHKYVTKQPSYNLPLWMVDDERIKMLFNKRVNKNAITIVEGVMGYYDGHGVDTITGSTAHLAEVLELPVILIMDASSMALTAAAIVKGMVDFRTPSHIKGIILNNVGHEKHYNLLKAAIESHTSVKCYGYVKKNSAIIFESRHLGLIQAMEIGDLEVKLNLIHEMLEDTVEVDALLKDFCANACGIDEEHNKVYDLKELESISEMVKKMNGLCIGIAKDSAFSFYYDENIATLNELGIKCLYFSPLHDENIPSECDAIYIGGGYPEEYAKELSQNKAFLSHLKDRLEDGLPAYVECGGLMYLSTEIVDCTGEAFEMVDFFKAKSIMTKKLQHFGHVEDTLDVNAILGKNASKKEIVYRAHEFHKSTFDPLEHIDQVIKVNKNEKNWNCGYFKMNTLGTYSHNHFYSNLDFLAFLIQFWGQNKF